MTHGERPPARVVQGRIYAGRADGDRLVVEPSERGDRAVQLWVVGQGRESGMVEISPDALRALVPDLRDRLTMLEAFAPDGAL